MDVSDQLRNNILRNTLNNALESYQDENVIVLGDFNGHTGIVGDQPLNANGRYVLELIEKC